MVSTGVARVHPTLPNTNYDHIFAGLLRVSYGFHSISFHIYKPTGSQDAASLPTRNRPEVTLSGTFTSWGYGEINQQMRKPKPGCVDMELRGQSWDPMPCLYLFILQYILIFCISKGFRARHFLSKDGSMPLREHYDLSLFLFLLPICFRDGPTWKNMPRDYPVNPGRKTVISIHLQLRGETTLHQCSRSTQSSDLKKNIYPRFWCLIMFDHHSPLENNMGGPSPMFRQTYTFCPLPGGEPKFRRDTIRTGLRTGLGWPGSG